MLLCRRCFEIGLNLTIIARNKREVNRALHSRLQYQKYNKTAFVRQDRFCHGCHGRPPSCSRTTFAQCMACNSRNYLRTYVAATIFFIRKRFRLKIQLCAPRTNVFSHGASRKAVTVTLPLLLSATPLPRPPL